MINIAFGKGFINSSKINNSGAKLYPVDVSTGMPIVSEKKSTQVSNIGGKKIKERKGKLTKDLGKKPSEASKAELTKYVNDAPSAAERSKRQARVNLARAHMKGTKAAHGKAPHIPAVKKK